MAREREVWRPLPSFAWEVLTTRWLANYGGDLADHFAQVLRRIADGELDGLVLPDPADARNDVIARVSSSERTGIRREAQRALQAIENRTWSALFSGASPPLPATNLGGRTFG